MIQTDSFKLKEENISDYIPHKSFYKDFARKTFKKSSFIIPSLILLTIFIIGLILCHFVDLETRVVIDMDKNYLSPSLSYPFGTNAFGENQLYLVLIGAYKTLLLSFIATLINLVIGIIIGMLWGTSKKIDSFMFVFKNLVDNTPLIFFYVLIVAILGDGFIPLLIVVTLFGWLEFACLIRNNLMLLKTKDYNKISKLYNVPLMKVAINNYLPSLLPLIFNNIALCIPKMIALEITVSYFGFSFGASYDSLGMLMYSSISNNSYYTYPHLFLIPFIFLFIINLCTYFISKTVSNNFVKEEI